MTHREEWTTIGVEADTKRLLDPLRIRAAGGVETWDHFLRRLAETKGSPRPGPNGGRATRAPSRIPGIGKIADRLRGHDANDRHPDAASIEDPNAGVPA